jgi:hypothetical protein
VRLGHRPEPTFKQLQIVDSFRSAECRSEPFLQNASLNSSGSYVKVDLAVCRRQESMKQISNSHSDLAECSPDKLDLKKRFSPLKLFIVGNGFDLNFGLPTRLADFGEYLRSNEQDVFSTLSGLHGLGAENGDVSDLRTIGPFAEPRIRFRQGIRRGLPDQRIPRPPICRACG